MYPGVPGKTPGLETRDSLLVVVKWFVVTGVFPFLIVRPGHESKNGIMKEKDLKEASKRESKGNIYTTTEGRTIC